MQSNRWLFEANAPQTTNADFATNPQDALVAKLSARKGKYLFIVNFDAQCSTNNRQVQADITIDDGAGVIIPLNPFTMEPKNPVNKMYPEKSFTLDLDDKSYTFKIRFGKSGGTGAAFVTMSGVTLLIQRV